jgi:hypothetical protein
MYATIHRYDQVTASTDQLVAAGRRLAARMSRVAGFVAYVLLDARDGVLTAVSIFEDEASQAEGARVLGCWIAEQRPAMLPDQPHVTSGEVIVQMGL